MMSRKSGGCSLCLSFNQEHVIQCLSSLCSSLIHLTLLLLVVTGSLQVTMHQQIYINLFQKFQYVGLLPTSLDVLVHLSLIWYSKDSIVACLSMTAVIGDCDVCHHLAQQQHHHHTTGSRVLAAQAGYDEMATAWLHQSHPFNTVQIGLPSSYNIMSYQLSQQQQDEKATLTSTIHLQPGFI